MGGVDELLALPKKLDELDGKWLALRERVCQAYLDALRPKVEAILDSCAAWGVKLVVLPEYSIPWQLLDRVARSGMCIVAGSHSVTRQARKSRVYGPLATPEIGTSVAPIFQGDQLIHLSGKLSANKEESRGEFFKSTEQWRPIEIEGDAGVAGPLATMICFDFIQRETEAHRELVGPQLDAAGLIALPTFTPWHSHEKFSGGAWIEACHHKRPVLWANCAAEGGTTIIVDDDPKAPQPLKVPVFERGEEGILVADVDLGAVRVGGSTSFGEQPVVRLVASASLVYQNTQASEEYARWATETAQLVAKDDVDLEVVLERIEASEDVLDKTMALPDAPMRTQRIRRLKTRLNSISDVEVIGRLTREVVLPPEALPLSWVQHGLALGAKRQIASWRETYRYGLEAIEQSLGAAIGKRPLENVSTSAATAVESLAQQVAGFAATESSAEARKQLATITRLLAECLTVGEKAVDEAIENGTAGELEAKLRDDIEKLEAVGGSSTADSSIVSRLAVVRLELARLLLNLQRRDESIGLLESVDAAYLSAEHVLLLARMWSACESPDRARALLDAIPVGDRPPNYDKVSSIVSIAQGDLPAEDPQDAALQVELALYHLDHGDFAQAARFALLARPEEAQAGGNVLTLYVVLANALYQSVFEPLGDTVAIDVRQRAEVIETLEALRDGHLQTWLENARGPQSEGRRRMVLDATCAFHELIDEREEWPEVKRDDDDACGAEDATQAAKECDLDAARERLPSTGKQPWTDELRRATLLVSAGDIDGALEEARRLVDVYPRRGPIEHFLAALLHERGDDEGAVQHAEIAYEQVPGGGVRLLFAICLVGVGRVSQAWALLEPILERAGPYTLRIAAVIAEKSAPNDALELWKRYLEHSPDAHEDRIAFARALVYAGEKKRAADEAWAAVQGSQRTLPLALLSLAAQLQMDADGLPLERRHRMRDIAAELGERFPNDANAEMMRVQLFALAGVEKEPNLSLLVQGGHAFAFDLDGGVPLWLQEAQAFAEIQERLYKEGGVSLQGLALVRAQPYVQTLLRRWNDEGAPFCSPNPWEDGPQVLLKDLQLIIGPIELLLLAHLELFDALQQAHEQHGLKLIVPLRDVERLRTELLPKGQTDEGERRLRSWAQSWLSVDWIVTQTWQELVGDVEPPTLPGLKIEQPWAEGLLKHPLEERLRQAAALDGQGNQRRVLAIDEFATEGISNVDLALSFNWVNRAQGVAIVEFLRGVSGQFMSVPALVRALERGGLMTPRAGLRTRTRLAKQGFGDALKGQDLLVLAHRSSGSAGRLLEDDTLHGLESPARNPNRILRSRGEISIAGTYADVIVEDALGAESSELRRLSASATRAQPAALPSTVRSLIAKLLGRLEQIDAQDNGPLLEYTLSLVAVKLVERVRDAYAKSPTDSDRLELSPDTPSGRLWTALHDWAGPSGQRRNSLDRAISDAWVTLDLVSPTKGPGSKAGPLLLTADFRQGKNALVAKYETLAILSANWDERPLKNFGETITVRDKHDPTEPERETIVLWEDALKFGAEHAPFDGGAGGRYMWIDYKDSVLPTPYGIFAPVDAVVLRAKDKRLTAGLDYLTYMLGATDGIAYQHLQTLSQTPSEEARREYARYSADALWRHVRDDPRYLAAWPRRFQYASGESPSLGMLCKILHEPNRLIAEGSAAEALRARLKTWSGLSPYVQDEFSRHLSELPGLLNFQPAPDPENQAAVTSYVEQSVRRLRSPGQYAAGTLASDVRFLMVTLARGTTVVALQEGTVNLGDFVPHLLGEVLDFESHAGSMARYEDDLIRVCGRVVMELLVHTPRRATADFLWLTYRLHAWLAEQLRLSDPAKREAGIKGLVEATRRPDQRAAIALDQMFNPFEFDRFGFKYRKAVLLSAFVSGVYLARQQEGVDPGFSPFSPGLERRLLEIAQSSPRESADTPAESWIDWPLPLAVPDLAAELLLQTNPGRLVTGDPSSLIRRINTWPKKLSTLRSGERMFIQEFAGNLGFGISQLDEQVTAVYTLWVRDLDQDDPASKTVREIALPTLFGHGEDELQREARAAVEAHVEREGASVVLGHFFAGIARGGATQLVAEADGLLAVVNDESDDGQARRRENVAVGLARVAIHADAERSVTAVEAMSLLSERVELSDWEHLRVLLAHVQGKDAS